MDSSDWVAVVGVAVAVVLAVVAVLQARRAHRASVAAEERVREATGQLRRAEETSAAARAAADEARDQAASAREHVASLTSQLAMDRVDRALEIHRGARDLVGTIVRTLEPDHGTASGRLPNPGAGKQANPRVIELRRFAERLDDLRLSDVAHYYYQVEKYAAAAVGVLGEMPGRQTGQALRFESLLLDLRTNAAAAEDAWAAWRDFQLAGVPGPAAAPVRPKSGAPLS